MNKSIIKTEKDFYVDDYKYRLHPEARTEMELNSKQQNLFKKS